MDKGKIIIYQASDGTTNLEVRLEEETVWLTQQQIADLFNVKQPAISKHIKNIYDSGELNEHSTYSILEYMGNENKQKYQTKFYNLDMILSVGYRVNSKNATQFRIWANPRCPHADDCRKPYRRKRCNGKSSCEFNQ
jgi:hypothetical protein